MKRGTFRGKYKDRWYYGALLDTSKATYCFEGEAPEDNDVCYIFYTVSVDWGLANRIEQVEVDPKTVGEFTGLYDKNKHMIFEGDILKYFNLELPVVYDEKNARFAVDWDGRLDTLIFNENFAAVCEVKGDIYGTTRTD